MRPDVPRTTPFPRLRKFPSSFMYHWYLVGFWINLLEGLYFFIHPLLKGIPKWTNFFKLSFSLKKKNLLQTVLRQFIENWAFPELIPKLIYHLNIILKTHFRGSSKRFAIIFIFFFYEKLNLKKFVHLGMPFNKGWIKKYKPSSKSIYHSILFLVGRQFKIVTNSGNF